MFKPVKFLISTIWITVMLGSSAFADVERISSSGDVYVVTENEHGFVLTSRFPKSRQLGQGSGSYFVEAKDVFYFGRSCDVYHELFGEGTWGWSNAGFGAQFDNGFSLGFIRQDVPWEGGSHCWE